MGFLKCLTTSAFRAAKTFFDHSVDWFYWFSLMEPIIYSSRIVRFLRLPEIVKPPLMHVCERPHQRAAEVSVTWHSLGDLLEKLTLWPKSSTASRPAQDGRLHGGAFLGPRWTSVANLSLCVRFKLQEIKSLWMILFAAEWRFIMVGYLSSSPDPRVCPTPGLYEWWAPVLE